MHFSNNGLHLRRAFDFKFWGCEVRTPEFNFEVRDMTRGRRCALPTHHVDDVLMRRPFNWRRDTICSTMNICTMRKSNYRDNCICRGWESQRGVTLTALTAISVQT
jgi:hypothetical protein